MIKNVRTPEEYWQTLVEAFPPIEDVRLIGLRHTFFAGMSAMVSVMSELWSSPMTEAEQKTLYREFVGYIHLNDGLERDSNGSIN